MARKATASAIELRRKRRPEPEQMDLFASRRGAGAPYWPDLPKDARETLVGLMTQLILDHARAAAQPTTAEASHDR
jgi:hypothetical protein